VNWIYWSLLSALFAGASLFIGLMWSKERVRAEGLSAELRTAEAGLFIKQAKVMPPQSCSGCHR